MKSLENARDVMRPLAEGFRKLETKLAIERDKIAYGHFRRPTLSINHVLFAQFNTNKKAGRLETRQVHPLLVRQLVRATEQLAADRR